MKGKVSISSRGRGEVEILKDILIAVPLEDARREKLFRRIRTNPHRSIARIKDANLRNFQLNRLTVQKLGQHAEVNFDMLSAGGALGRLFKALYWLLTSIIVIISIPFPYLWVVSFILVSIGWGFHQKGKQKLAALHDQFCRLIRAA